MASDESLELELERQARREIEGELEKTKAALLASQMREEELCRRLVQAQRMEILGQLVGGIAHDFNNLLVAIQGGVSMAIEDLVPGCTARIELTEVHDATERAAGLTAQLLAFSRQRGVAAQPTELNAFIPQTLSLLRRVMGELVRVRFAPRGEIATARVDRAQLTQAILNLCMNARDAMPDGGELTVRTGVMDATEGSSPLPDQRCVFVAVEDEGHGMTEEVQRRALEAFFTTKSDGRGTGLGLSVVQEVVRHHGGTIRIDSQPGKGTTVTLFFPFVAPERPRAAVGPTSTIRRRAQGTVLVVEDDEVEDDELSAPSRVVSRES